MPAGNWRRIPGELSLVLTPPCPLSLRAAIYPSQIPRTWITEKRSPNVLIRPRVPHFSNSLNSFRTFLNRFLSESQGHRLASVGSLKLITILDWSAMTTLALEAAQPRNSSFADQLLQSQLTNITGAKHKIYKNQETWTRRCQYLETIEDDRSVSHRQESVDKCRVLSANQRPWDLTLTNHMTPDECQVLSANQRPGDLTLTNHKTPDECQVSTLLTLPGSDEPWQGWDQARMSVSSHHRVSVTPPVIIWTQSIFWHLCDCESWIPAEVLVYSISLTSS